MPAKNALKRYTESGSYHLYNRGVAKNEIFLQEQDYLVFVHYLKEYLSPPKPLPPEVAAAMRTPYLLKNYHGEIELIAFCLMPNHFHLLLKQKGLRSIESFMRSLLIRYTAYFNKNHQRVGHVFQGVYKGKLIEQDEYFWWLTRYIHRNPLELLQQKQKLIDYPYSSYPTYLGKTSVRWLSTQDILGRIKNYQEFAEGKEENLPENYPDLILEEEKDSS